MAIEGIDRFEKILRQWGLPIRLNDIGLLEKDIDSITDDVVRISFQSDGLMLSRPMASRDDIINVFRLAL